LNKYGWYFRYRAALLQVEYPTQFVEMRTFDYKYKPTYEILLNRKKDLLIAQKGLYTKSVNKLEDYKKEWNSLFPIEEDARYLKTIEKLKVIQSEVLKLETDYEEYKTLTPSVF
jgi:hypothetical protein